MDDIAIKVDGVSKSFRLPHEKSSTVKSSIINIFRGQKGYEMQHALKDINFDVKKGEFFGIVGRNGSGKSTLLKLLAGIYTPDKGGIQVNGSLTPFIELGVGFNPELTGRENVFLNGALLGFSRKQMQSMYADIVEFAELGRFMDQKLKNYSSGMQVRLAFSIAIRAKSDILILDEVLAVGDAAFQKKCLAIFEDYKRNNQTIILVTHDMSVVEKYCSRAIYIEDGDIVMEGNPTKIAKRYRTQNEEAYIQSLSAKQKKSENQEKIKQLGIKWKLTNDKGEAVRGFEPGEKLHIDLSWQNDQVKNVGVALLKQTGEYVFGTNTVVDEIKIQDKKVSYDLTLDISAGDYIFYFGFFGETEADANDFIDDGPKILIKESSPQGWQGVTNLKHQWK